MSNLADRRRNNGPPGGTTAPVFAASTTTSTKTPQSTAHKRQPQEIRKIFLRTGLISSTTGSSFLEISPLKLSVSVLGPRPLPRTSTTPFTAHAILTTEVKFAPFASSTRRGYVRDSTERDISARLYQALVGSIRTDLYPKSRIEVIVTILDSDDSDGEAGDGGLTGVLSGCITASSAALADAGIEVYDLVSGGVCSLVGTERTQTLDPQPGMEDSVVATAVVGYMSAREEITEVWSTGRMKSGDLEKVMDGAVEAARMARTVLDEAVAERVKFIVEKGAGLKAVEVGSKEVEMTG